LLHCWRPCSVSAGHTWAVPLRRDE
jgi:hypothetical protein